MSIVSSLWTYSFSSFFYLSNNILHRFIGDVFHQHHTNIISAININQTADVAGVVWYEFSKNELTVEIRVFNEDFPACLHNIVSDSWSCFLWDSLQKGEKLVDSKGNIVVDESLVRSGPGGEYKFPSGAEGLRRGIEEGDENVYGNKTYEE